LAETIEDIIRVIKRTKKIRPDLLED